MYFEKSGTSRTQIVTLDPKTAVFYFKSTDLQCRTAATVSSLSLGATESLDVPITPFHYQRPTLSNKEVKCIAMCCAHLGGLELSCAFSCVLLNKYMDSG